MDIYLSEKIDKDETKILERASLIMEGRAQLQRIRLGQQLDLIRSTYLKRENLKSQILESAHEFSTLLGQDTKQPYRVGAQKEGLMGLGKIQSELAQRIGDIDVINEQLIVEEGSLLAETGKSGKLDFTDNQLRKTVSYAWNRLSLIEEQREIDEFTEIIANRCRISNREGNKENDAIVAENCSIGQGAREEQGDSGMCIREWLPNEFNSEHDHRLDSNIDFNELNSEDRVVDNSICQRSNEDTDVSETKLDEEDHQSIESCNQADLFQCQIGASSQQLAMSKAFRGEGSAPSASELGCKESTCPTNKESIKLTEYNSLTVTLPVAGYDNSEDASDALEVRAINWEKRLLTISISEQDGKTSIDLLGNTILRETLANARRYFEGELRELFNPEVVIKECYHS